MCVSTLTTVVTLGTAGIAFAAPQEGLLYDGKLNPACVWETETGTNGALRPISVVTDFGCMREIGGVRILSPRSWVNCCVRKASFYALDGGARSSVALAEHVSFRPANTYSELSASWPKTPCRQVKMVIEDTWDRVGGYYDWVTMPALQDGSYVASLGGLRYDVWAGPRKTVQIAELEYLEEVSRPLAKRPGEGYPQVRLERDWLYQSCAPGGNTGLVANTTVRGRRAFSATTPSFPCPSSMRGRFRGRDGCWRRRADTTRDRRASWSSST